MKGWQLKEICSGGQTGADRAARDWALIMDFPHGGWCPRGRLAEDGPLPQQYQLKQTKTRKYSERTRLNIMDSCGTAIFSTNPVLSGGTFLTAQLTKACAKPLLHLLAGDAAPARRLQAFVHDHAVHILNVAGPRASGEPSVYDFVMKVLKEAFGSP